MSDLVGSVSRTLVQRLGVAGAFCSINGSIEPLRKSLGCSPTQRWRTIPLASMNFLEPGGKTSQDSHPGRGLTENCRAPLVTAGGLEPAQGDLDEFSGSTMVIVVTELEIGQLARDVECLLIQCTNIGDLGLLGQKLGDPAN